MDILTETGILLQLGTDEVRCVRNEEDARQSECADSVVRRRLCSPYVVIPCLSR